MVYNGQWNIKTNKRHGRGEQIWRNGAKYLGNWADDMANGEGRLIYGDGDFYEGQ